jgi:hypothetical protein
MKCFERLVKDHIILHLTQHHRPTSILTPLQQTTQSPSHTALSHPDKRNTYVRMLFIDYSSAFNTIVPSKLITKLRSLGLNPSLCNWVLDFLTSEW